MKRKYSLHCPQFLKTGNSPEFSMHGGPVCGQGDHRRWWIVDTTLSEHRKVFVCLISFVHQLILIKVPNYKVCSLFSNLTPLAPDLSFPTYAWEGFSRCQRDMRPDQPKFWYYKIFSFWLLSYYQNGVIL